MKKIGIRLISFVGIRDKFFSRYFEEGVVFDEGIELSLLSGGIEEYDRCQWIKKIKVPDSYGELFQIIQKSRPDFTIVYIGR